MIYNRGPAVGRVEAPLQALDGAGRVIDSSSEDIVNIPADSFFAIGTLTVDGRKPATDVDVVWTSDASAFGPRPRYTWATDTSPLPRGRENPFNVSVSSTISSGSGPSPEYAKYQVILLDRSGNIVGGGNDFAHAPIRPGQTSRDVVELFLPRSAASAIAYLDIGLL